MPLTCYCDWEPEAGDTVLAHASGYSVLQSARRKRCQSCGSMIDVGATVASFPRYKVPDTDVEEKIYGEDGEVPRAPHYLCEMCADLYFSLMDLGFECIGPWEDMREMVQEYAALYGAAA